MVQTSSLRNRSRDSEIKPSEIGQNSDDAIDLDSDLEITEIADEDVTVEEAEKLSGNKKRDERSKRRESITESVKPEKARKHKKSKKSKKSKKDKSAKHVEKPVSEEEVEIESPEPAIEAVDNASEVEDAEQEEQEEPQLEIQEDESANDVEESEKEVPESEKDTADVLESQNDRNDSSEEVDSDSDDSGEEIAIVLVENLPDNRKFLRKRKAHVEKASASKKPKNEGENADFESEVEEVQSESDDDFVDAVSAGGVEDLTDETSAPALPPPEIPEIIEVDSETEDAPVAPKSSTASSATASPIRLLFNPSYGLEQLTQDLQVNMDTVTINELVGTKDLKETYQFNFNIDLEYFLSFLHPDFSKNRRKLYFITGNSFLNVHPLKAALTKKFDITEVVASLPNRFASHHSKMMVNFFDNDEVEIVVMTSNLTQLDFGGLTQALWKSGRLKKGKTTTTLGKRFRLDLIRYLAKYKASVTNRLLKKLDHLDFSSVDVELVASAPGVYPLNDLKPAAEAYGYVKLRQVLERNGLLLDGESDHNILAQVTSIAYPYSSRKGHTSSIFTHLLCPLLFNDWKRLLEPGAEASESHQEEFKYKPLIVFPTAREIAGSNFGFLSGSAVHFKYTTSAVHKQQYEQNVKPYLCKWGNGHETGRERVTPHVKYYACDNGDDWQSLKWVLVGSHNLSKQAWGHPLVKSKGESYEVDSYELSVLKPGNDQSLVPVYGSDVLEGDSESIPIRFPFVVPPTPYTNKDKPWSPDVDFGSLKDRWGNTHHGSFV